MKYALKSGSGAQLPNGVMLQTIIARLDFTTIDGVEVKDGDEGGLVQSANNLSQEGKCWIHKGGRVYGKARVLEDAVVCANVDVNGRSLVKGVKILNNAEGI